LKDEACASHFEKYHQDQDTMIFYQVATIRQRARMEAASYKRIDASNGVISKGG